MSQCTHEHTAQTDADLIRQFTDYAKRNPDKALVISSGILVGVTKALAIKENKDPSIKTRLDVGAHIITIETV